MLFFCGGTSNSQGLKISCFLYNISNTALEIMFKYIGHMKTLIKTLDLVTISELFPYTWEHVYTDAVKLDTFKIICSSTYLLEKKLSKFYLKKTLELNSKVTKISQIFLKNKYA